MTPPDTLSDGLQAALAAAVHLGPTDIAGVTVSQCLARRIDRLIEQDEPVSASLFGAYERSLLRLGLASASSRKAPTNGPLARLRAENAALRSVR